jgi:hypothetical protein
LNKKNIYYVTFNETFNGIYESQVIDVVKLYISKQINSNLIAFIPLKNFFKERRKIKIRLSRSIIIPIFFKLNYWNLNKFWFLFFSINSKDYILCRSIFAFNLVPNFLLNKCKVIYDGRGAICYEQKEFGVYNGTSLENEIFQLEQNSVIKSHHRIAVSNKLVKFWENTFFYVSGKETVIPSSTSTLFERSKNLLKIKNIKKRFQIKPNNKVFIYSGSSADWQSFKMISSFANKLIVNQPNTKFIFLTSENKYIDSLVKDFPNRVFRLLVPYEDVVDYLDVSDFGILLRTNSMTSKVSSPVKCAEYLIRGLKVIISENIGDYSKLIYKNNLGFTDLQILNDCTLINDEFDKLRIQNFAHTKFSKKSILIQDKYLNLID